MRTGSPQPRWQASPPKATTPQPRPRQSNGIYTSPPPAAHRSAIEEESISEPLHQITGTIRAVGNSVATFAIQMIGKLSSFAGFYIVSIALPLRDLGFYMLVVALREILSALAALGLDVILMRGLTQATSLAAEKRLLRDAAIIKLITALLGGAGMVAAAYVLQADPDLTAGAVIGAGDLVVMAVSATLYSYYGSHLRTSSLTGLQAAVSALYIGLLVLGVWAGVSWLALLEIRLLTDSVLCVAVAFKLGQRLGPIVIDKPADRWGMFWSSIPLGVVSIAILIYTRIDTVLLEQLRGPTEVAYYTVTYKLTEAPLIIITSIAATTLPIVSAWGASPASRQRIIDATQRALRYSYAAALLIAVGLSLFGGDLIALLYGPRFASVLPAMTVLIWAMVAMASNIVSAAVLTAMRKTHMLMIGAIFNLALNVALNLWAIPQWGYFGSAVATAVTEGLNTVVQVIILCVALRRLRLAFPFGLALGIGATTLGLMFGGFVTLSRFEEIVAMAALVVLVALCRLVTYDDLSRLYRALMRRRRRRSTPRWPDSTWPDSLTPYWAEGALR